MRKYRLHYGVVWTQWNLGVWWWPIKKDRTIGFNFGPVFIYWTRMSVL